MQIPASACSILEKSFEDVTLVEFMYLVLTRTPGESYRRRLRSLLLYLCVTYFERNFICQC